MTMTLRWIAALVVLPLCLVVVHGQQGPSAVADRSAGVGPAATDLAQRAVIRRDRYGVPHILADSEEAAAFAHGYVTAEDHGALLARAFLRARGALASVFGPEFVADDVRARTLRLLEGAAEQFASLPPFMRAILNGYAAGYNRFLARHPAELPAWATPVTGVDVLAANRAILLLDFALDPRPWAAPPRTGASNMWAIAGSRTESGRAILLANPHLGWEGDGATLLHEVHLTVPNVINVSGAAVVGAPVVGIGFNDSLGWTQTVNRFDSDDVYELTLDESRTRYLYDGGWLPLQSRELAIDVRADGGLRTERHTALWSHHGPVVRVEGGKAYAVKSPNLDAAQFLTQYNLMGKASSLAAFTAAVSMHEVPTFNLGYADKAGNIWYLFNARIPLRPPGYQWAGIVPGNTSKSEWFTVWPIRDLPQLLNPPSGYLQNANDAPWYVNLQDRVDRARFANYLGIDGTTWRGQFGLKVLSNEQKLTLEKVTAYKWSDTVLFVDRVKSELIEAVRARGEEWREAADVLDRWDNEADADSRGAVLFLGWWEEYTRGLAAPFRTVWNSADPIATPRGIADMDRAMDAFGRAVATVAKTYGALDVPWGEVHRLRRGNLDLPADGATMTFRNAAFRTAPDNRRVMTAGDSYVLVVEFGDVPRAYSIGR
jgi:acyl-homoserine-lactone acylase